MKFRTIAFMVVCACAAAYAAPKVAVLDAVLPQGMNAQVSIGVTEKISEELVASGKYTVLDRTTVGQSLKEIEFQMSGLVSDADIKKAGEQLNSRLGATYVVVARVSQLGNTFFISAKLIDIKTGEITAQASYEAEGNVAITLSVAQVVGKKLALGAKETVQLAEEPKKTDKPAKLPNPQPQQPQPAAPQPSATPSVFDEPSSVRSRVTISYLLPTDGGTSLDVMAAAFPLVASDSLTSYGVNAHLLQFFMDGGYFSLYMGFCETDVDYGTGSGSYYYTIDGEIGMGWGFPLIAGLQIYAGGLIGIGSLALGDTWTDPDLMQIGLSFGAEAGVDWVFLDLLCLSCRIHYTYMSMEEGDIFLGTTDFGSFGLSLGAGFAL